MPAPKRVHTNAGRKRTKPRPKPNPPKTSGPGGENRIEIDCVQLERMAGMMCTQAEAAALLGIHVATLERRLAVDGPERKAWDEGREKGKASLRRTQFKLAETNTGMAIFLGKNYLGQRDVQAMEHSGPDGKPIEHARNLSRLDDDELEALERLASKAAGEAEKENA